MVDFRDVVDAVWDAYKREDVSSMVKVQKIRAALLKHLSERSRTSLLVSAMNALSKMFRRNDPEICAAIQAALIAVADRAHELEVWNDPTCPIEVVERVWRIFGITKTKPSDETTRALFEMSRSRIRMSRVGTEFCGSMLRSWGGIPGLQVPTPDLVLVVDRLLNARSVWPQWDTENEDIPIGVICLFGSEQVDLEGRQALERLSKALREHFQS